MVLEAAEVNATDTRVLLYFMQQVVDRLVRTRGNPTRLPSSSRLRISWAPV